MSNEPKTTVETEEKTYYHGGKAVARKFAFASGELVYNLPWMLVSSYLAFFMTDVALIPASAVSILFLICRIWDAINDPMIGSLADRTNTKMGRYRPWMLGGAIGLIPLVVLLFWAHPDWSVGARTAYGCILYFVTVVASTSWNIPFSALNGVISPYPRERASFSSYRIFISSIACSVATALFIPFVTKFSGAEGNTVRGYLLAALVICCMAIPFVFTSILGTKEVVKAPPQQKQKFHAKEMAACFTKNPPLLIVCFAFLVYGFLNYGRMTVGMYYFTYVWGDVSLFTLYATVNGLICAVAAFFSAALVKLCRGKRGALLLSYGLSFILNIIRTLPTLVIASICALVFGLGTFAGTIAIVVFTFGVVTKMLYESIETINMGAFEALESAGADKFRAFWSAVFPQVLPTYLSHCLYSFEMNVRAASILGYVGAGGLGILIDERIGWRDYNGLGTVLLTLFVAVLLIENLSQFLRSKLS